MAAGGIAGAATSSPAVGFAVGVATDAAGIAAVRHLGRRWGREEQDAIAEAAGRLRAGEWGGWRVSRPFPFRDGRGEVRVVGSIENPLAPCKEFLFSAAEADGEDGLAAASPRRWHAAAVCLQADGSWGWASAEPAVGRWGYLH